MSTYAPTFYGTPDKSGKLPDAVRKDIVRALKVLAGHPVSVQVKRHVPKRTNPQNDYLHVCPFPIMAAFFGDSVTETKRALMGECWGWRLNEKTGRHVPIREHTRDMNIEEATFFIDWLLPWAMTKWNVTIPLPTERQHYGEAQPAHARKAAA